ncbi:glyoxalase superfamily protein [Rhodovibrionaceae bacterium A322]
MTGSSLKLSLEDLKQQAKTLRQDLAGAGSPISHGQALEQLARQKGYRNWNTLRALAQKDLLPDQTPTWLLAEGQRVSGVYLGQPFEAEVLKAEEEPPQNSQRVTLHFDAPVDVVSFDSFSCYRQRVSCTLGRDGKTLERTSNGQPHLSLTR